MKILEIAALENWYKSNFQNSLSGRRILFEDISPLLQNLDDEKFEKSTLGYSEKNNPIREIKIGRGPKKILIWSQMHGNESTGTKAMFDLFQFFENPGIFQDDCQKILDNCTLWFVPMLNPDGSSAFTRLNANNIDLNRDAVALKAKESVLLRSVLEEFKPHFCFNLHDQRTIFNVEGTKNPATISFLAPSEDLERTLTKGRKETMSVIVEMNALLEKIIPGHIGRYTDEFYPTATGDNFQKLGHNTILIEAGHYYNDYKRDVVRKFNFYALLQGVLSVAENEVYSNYKPYFSIPNNDKKCFDVICRNVKIAENSFLDIAYQYSYTLKDNKLVLEKEEAARGELNGFIGHEEKDFQQKPLKPI